MTVFEPAYLDLLRTGELARRAAEARTHLTKCDLCGQSCKKDRLAGELGVCKTGPRARLSSYGPHFGEEAPLRGRGGSGTIFFTRCNLHCQFCQNHDISQTDDGKEIGPEGLAAVMLELQSLGCHNINLVSPSHVVAPILEALVLAAANGLRLPLVYNTGGYDAPAALRLLDGVIDIYMPDMKYASAQIALHYSRARDYPQVNRAAVREMHLQVGDLQLDERGIARRGLLVRHLVLPHGLAGTETVVRFLAEEISQDTYLNLMGQYRPAYHARQYTQLSRAITPMEYQAALDMARAVGLYRLD